MNLYDAALAAVPHRVTDPEYIPAARYYDREYFELEKELLWPKVWQMACRLEEIPNVGDYVEYRNLDKSVIVVRTKSGVKAFHNACRHRGVALVDGPGNCAKEGLICPFHGWRWNADGENTFVFGRRIFSEDVLDAAEINLKPVRIDEWAGCAFINLDDDALPLRECLGDVADRMDARHADKLKMDWWFGTELPTNWKLAAEAFQEGYHVMRTHPQLHELSRTVAYEPDEDGQPYVRKSVSGREAIALQYKHFANLSEGMAGMVHETELPVLKELTKLDVPDDPDQATQMFMGAAFKAITEDGMARGAPMFDIMDVTMKQGFSAVEYMFPHYFLLPMFGAMSSYRIRPTGPESCFFEIWSLAMRPEGEAYDTPKEPTILPYNSDEFPEIPRQDYSNLPRQQIGLHNFDDMRLSKQYEGMISNYQRLIDGFLAGLDRETLAKGTREASGGFDAPIKDIGF